MNAQQHAPGWYPDPSGAANLRWFDGKAWTDNQAPSGQFPPPPPAPKKGNGKKVAGVVAAGFLGLVVLGSIGDDNKKSESTTTASATTSVASPATAEAAAAKGDQPAPAGSSVRDGKFEFTVLGVERGATSIDDAFGPEKAKGEFFTVKLRVMNVGDDARNFSATNQKLIINGNKYEATSFMDEGWMEDINPGLGIETKATFDIPPGTVPTAIECHDSAFSGGALLAL